MAEKLTDIEIAKNNLDGHTISLCLNGKVLTDDGRGISPMMKFIAGGKDLKGCSAADAVVGKAAAMLFKKAGITSVYGEVMSRAADAYLSSQNIPHSYGRLEEKILNRNKDGLCPMEKTVAAIDDADEAYLALKLTVAKLQNGLR